MPRSKTPPSTPRLSEYARKFVYPSTIAKTIWPRVEAKGVELGLGFDWWQSQLGTVCVGYDSSGKYAATVGGIGLSIPRQVGKTYFVLALLVILCILFPGLQVVWTAHHLRTSTKTFTTLRGICRRKKVAPHIKTLRAANGEQQIEFANGSMIMFGARSMGFGRGFDEIDVEVFDEAQILDAKALEDMIAATNQSRHEHGALLFFMGTPPRPTDPSGAFTARRADAWSGESDDAIWLEIGADPASDPDDRSQWPLMNPSYPKRTPVESMLRLKKNIGDDDSWNREGRGIWDPPETGAAPELVDPKRWGALEDKGAAMEKVRAFSLEVTPDRQGAAIVAAGPAEDGRIAVEVLPWCSERPVPPKPIGVGWVLDRCRQLDETHGPAPFVIDAGGPAGSFIAPLQQAGIQVVIGGIKEITAATAEFVDAVDAGSIAHGPQEELDDAVRKVKKRPLGDGGFAISRKKSPVDVTALIATTLAHWYAATNRAPEVWSIAEMVEQLKKEQAESEAAEKGPTGA